MGTFFELNLYKRELDLPETLFYPQFVINTKWKLPFSTTFHVRKEKGIDNSIIG